MDVLTIEQRRFCMSRIRPGDTGPELRLRKALWGRGHRYRLRSKLLGRPDLIFPKAKIAVFVDGCFWHGCAEHCKLPKTNANFWSQKIARNVQRDQQVTAALVSSGWTVIRSWEHDITLQLDLTVKRISVALDRASSRRS